MRTTTLWTLLCGCLVASATIVGVAEGGTLQYDLTTVYGNSAPVEFPDPAPSGVPFLELTDLGPDVVRLTISLEDLSAEKVKSALLNFDEEHFALAPGNFSFVGGQEAESVSVNTDRANATPNPFKAGGGGKFNIALEYDTAQHRAFVAGETSVYDITYPGLTAAAFEGFLSFGGANGDYHVAMHVQAVPSAGGGSLWVGDGPPLHAPEPSSLVILALGAPLVGVVAWRRRKAEAG